MQKTISNLVSAQWLKENIPSVKLLYTRLADIKTGVVESQDNKIIHNAVLFDFENEFADSDSPLPHTLPSEQQFVCQVKRLGLNTSDHIVVYDSKGLYAAPRVWWMFKVMGFNNVSVLDGGLPAWLALGESAGSEASQPAEEGNFVGAFNPSHLIDLGTLTQGIDTGQINVIDARSAARFKGEAAEPRAHLRSGHMPGAFNLPFTELVNGDGKLRTIEEIKIRFTALGLKPDSPLVFSCGSGVTACILALAAEEIGMSNWRVYDGSWSEWGANEHLPVVTNQEN